MAWVWFTNAEDTELRCFGAVELLPEDLSPWTYGQRNLARREARAASALNHFNACTIYEIEMHVEPQSGCKSHFAQEHPQLGNVIPHRTCVFKSVNQGGSVF